MSTGKSWLIWQDYWDIGLFYVPFAGGMRTDRSISSICDLVRTSVISGLTARKVHPMMFNPLSAGDAFKRIHTVFPRLKFDRN